VKEARDQSHRGPDPAGQYFTGWLKVTTTGTRYWPPLAQSGVQLSMFSVPAPVASVPVHVLQVMA
jgi:hypothetical protein